MLLDTSGTYAEELSKARAITNYLLGVLASGDSLGIARIDSASFTEKDIVARVTFDTRPSRTNEQKRAFRAMLDRFVDSAKGSGHTDITGAMLQATEWLNETGAGRKYILVFSDLEEDLRKGYVRDFSIDLSDIRVIALNVASRHVAGSRRGRGRGLEGDQRSRPPGRPDRALGLFRRRPARGGCR
jgi:hypothetical protein